MRCIAVDPGKNGAMVVLEDRRILEVVNIPLINEYGMKMTVDVDKVFDFYHENEPDFIVFEQIGVARKDGNVQAGSFLHNFGSLIGAAAGFNRRFVLPSQWKAYSGLRNTVKKASVGKACMFYPGAEKFLSTSSNPVDRADAILIGRFGMFKYGRVR